MRREILDAINREETLKVFPLATFIATPDQWDQLLEELSSLERRRAKKDGEVVLMDMVSDAQVLVLRGA